MPAKFDQKEFVSILDAAREDAAAMEPFDKIKSVSMLHVDTLRMISECARRATGTVLEIGAYIGGSTIALADGVSRKSAEDQVDLITIEPGGSYPDQPHLPTDDILADWEKNLTEFGFRDKVFLIKGFCGDPAAFNAVKDRLGDKKIGLFFVDGDGALESYINLYLNHMSDDCILVLDDYRYDSHVKGAELTQFIDRMVELGHFEEFAFVPWNTWFGRLNKSYRAYAEGRP